MLEVRGGEELVFQFYGREGWALARAVGSISPIQASLAERKLAKMLYGGGGRKKVRGRHACMPFMLRSSLTGGSSGLSAQDVATSILD